MDQHAESADASTTTFARSKLSETTFALSFSGRGGDPAQALVSYLCERNVARLRLIRHPLFSDQPGVHHLGVSIEGSSVRWKRIRFPNHPPITYVVDPLLDLLLLRGQVWVGMNPLATCVGLLKRRFGGTRFVVHYCIDFVPKRFQSEFLARTYRHLDRIASQGANLRIELSAAARVGRDAQLGLHKGEDEVLVLPMGLPVEGVIEGATPNESHPSLIFLGSLDKRMGTDVLIPVLALVRKRFPDTQLHIVGTGDEATEIGRMAESEGLGEAIHWHGFVANDLDVHKLLTSATLALAPYTDAADNFSRFADPGKIKAYLAAGCPIVMTAVPPIAKELHAMRAADIVGFSAEEIAESCVQVIGNEEFRRTLQANARRVAQEFRWESLFDRLFARVFSDASS